MNTDAVIGAVERVGLPAVVLAAVLGGLYLLGRDLVRAVGPAVASFLTQLTENLSATRREHQELRAHVTTEAAQIRDHVTREAAALREHIARETDDIEDAIVLSRDSGPAPSTRGRRRAPPG